MSKIRQRKKAQKKYNNQKRKKLKVSNQSIIKDKQRNKLTDNSLNQIEKLEVFPQRKEIEIPLNESFEDSPQDPLNESFEDSPQEALYKRGLNILIVLSIWFAFQIFRFSVLLPLYFQQSSIELYKNITEYYDKAPIVVSDIYVQDVAELFFFSEYGIINVSLIFFPFIFFLYGFWLYFASDIKRNKKMTHSELELIYSKLFRIWVTILSYSLTICALIITITSNWKG